MFLNDSSDSIVESSWQDRDDFEGEPFLPPAPVCDKEYGQRGKTPSERIAWLLGNMIPHKQTLLTAISACVGGATMEEAAAQVADIRKGSASVYGVENYLRMLEDVGALERITADGKPYESVTQEPTEVVDGEVTYLQVNRAPKTIWRATEAGLQALEENDPAAEARRLFASHAAYRDAFALILDMCSEPEGASIKELKAQVNERPDMMAVNKTAQFLLDYLQNAGLVLFDNISLTWKSSQAGRAALTTLGEAFE